MIPRGIACATAGFALYTGMDSLIKWLSAGTPLIQIVFFNAVFSMVAIAAMAAAGGRLGELGTRRPGPHLLRGLLAVAGAFCAFFAYSRMPLADAYALAFTAPLMITLLSAPFLAEPVGLRRWSLVGLGFLGVVVMLRPGIGVWDAGAPAALAGALFYSLSVLMVRRLQATETALAFGFWANLVAAAVAAPLLPLVWVAPPAADLARAALAGGFGGAAIVLLSAGFRLAPAAVAAPLQYTQLVWGTLVGVVVWGDRPDAWTLAGGALVIASGLVLLRQESAVLS